MKQPIAIVGMGGIFPDAPTIERFWENIRNGKSADSDVPDGRWPLPVEQLYDAEQGKPDHVYSRRGCYIKNFIFDPIGFDVDSDFLNELDPGFHLALYAAKQAFADASLKSLDPARTGVIIGNIALPNQKSSSITEEILGTYFEECMVRGSQTEYRTHPVNRYAVGFASTILSQAFGLKGISYTIDGACAASLYALKAAADELQAGRADTMLTGGLGRPDSLFTQMGFSQLRALSPTGVCAPFDKKANGLVVGEGAGILILKRLEDALRDNDRIYGVIRGIGLSNDTRGNLLAPDSDGQLRAMKTAYDQAGWSPWDVDLIECHATGTAVGDSVELNSLTRLWEGASSKKEKCVIGSVKSNVGHLLTGAGAAGLIKTLMAIDRQTLPPTANFSQRVDQLDPSNSPFRVLRKAEEWSLRDEKIPRRAAVSGFGFGGINAHLLIEEWIEPDVCSESSQIYLDDRPDIAVVGMDAHFGPWDSLKSFQERALGGGIPADPKDPTGWWGIEKSRLFKNRGWSLADFKGYWIDKIEVQPGQFRIPPKEIEETLPQQTLMLQTAARALADSLSYIPGKISSKEDVRTGVFIGIGQDLNAANFYARWLILHKARAWAKKLNLKLSEQEFLDWAQSLRDMAFPALTANRTVGALGGIVASRISREFRFGGPCFTLSGEESSGLLALQTAVRFLQRDDVDRAIAGAVDLHGDARSILCSHLLGSEIGSLFNDKTDKTATKWGEGAAAVTLKRLECAQRDQDKIYAVIKGVGAGYESNGSALDQALAEAKVAPDRIHYVETCGASPTHLLPREWTADNVERAVGNIRADIGHTGATIGLAGFVKTCLCLYRKIIPQERGQEPMPEGNFYRALTSQFWLRNRSEGARVALVSHIGAEGNFVHAVVEQAPELPDLPIDNDATAQWHSPLGPDNEALFIVRGNHGGELLEQLDRLHSFSQSQEKNWGHIEDWAREWRRVSNPDDKQKRLAISLIIRDKIELEDYSETISRLIQSKKSVKMPGNRVFFSQYPAALSGKIAFVYPGSGNHHPKMGGAISARWAKLLMRQDVENAYLKDQYIPRLMWNHSTQEGASTEDLIIGQVAYSTLMTDLLRLFKIQPQAAIGYSLGETSSLISWRAWRNRDKMLRRMRESTLFSRDLAGEFIAARKAWGSGEAVANHEKADWIAVDVHCSADRMRAFLKDSKRVYLLVINTPSRCVIGGERGVVETLLEKTGCAYRPLTGVSTVHCPIARLVEQDYYKLHYFEETTSPADMRFYSSAHRRAVSLNPSTAAQMITQQAMETINFPAVIRSAFDDGIRVFVEIGPGSGCTGMIHEILEGKKFVAFSACAADAVDESTILRLLGKLISEGVAVDLSPLYHDVETETVGLISHEKKYANAIRISTGGTPFPTTIPIPLPTIVHESVHEKITNFSPLIESGVEKSPLVPRLKQPESKRRDPTQQLILGLIEAREQEAKAHQAYLKFSQNMTRSLSENAEHQTILLQRLIQSGKEGLSLTATGSTSDPRLFMNREQCLEFAVGSVANLLGSEFAEVDNHLTRVRLPDEPLMLADRIISVHAEPRSLTSGTVITEHDILPGAWYLDCNRIPTCIAVEAGQADLFLSGYLGIDFVTKGEAVYRLLDATVVFHRGLPEPGVTIRYEIHIQEFFRQGETYLFYFNFESRIQGELFLSMRDGCAGFFTQTELDEGKGLVFTDMDRQLRPGIVDQDYRPLTRMEVEFYSDDQIQALRRGDLTGCFGSEFSGLPLDNPCRLPGGRMSLVHRILELDPNGGRYGLGQIRGEADIHLDDWFLTCHFKDDMVMPGTLMYECCLHTLRVLLTRMGWVGEQDEIAWEPIPGIGGQLKCRGQVTQITRSVIYEIALKEIGYNPEPYVICDAVMYSDRKPVVRMIDMSLRMSGMNREKLEALWSNQSNPQKLEHSKPALFPYERILAFAIGKPSDAFGDRYRIFDQGRVIARLPGPPYQFLDRITEVQGTQWEMQAKKQAIAQYDTPRDAWYFEANSYQNMPFAILLEIVLQPCGWLSAYVGSALTSEIDLSFRNLGGQAVQYLPIDPDSGALTATAELTDVSTSGGMIIQHYKLGLTNESGDTVYEGTTYFGFFSKQALANQIGIQNAPLHQPTVEEFEQADAFPYPTEPPFPNTQLRMIDRIDMFLPDGGPHGLGFIRGVKEVAPEEWFFKAHFYQDPVWPGSLGLEAFLQLLKVVAVRRWGWKSTDRIETVSLNQPHLWTYRGQVIPSDRLVSIQAAITEIDDERRFLKADGFLTVDGRTIYEMKNFTITCHS
ncbi:MAG: hypothetical protein B6244_10640 [Candidatus Cloacimonetes bacterium 4572_55]|nr:MAG: hypothetical protein B6244_10640 [Candidatus Cloacimonetes bacterium 4572_55]